MRLWAVGVVLVFFAGALCADDWPGFRGLQRQNVSASPIAPLYWSRTENVRWHTPLPGEGHSSPIVVGDSIYLSYAIEQPQPAHFLTGVRVSLLVLAWGLLATALWTVAARCREALTWRGVVSLGGMVALAAAMALLVMYGENVLTFDRALERGWMAAVLSFVLALVLVISASEMETVGGVSRPRPGSGGGCGHPQGESSPTEQPSRGAPPRPLWAAVGLMLLSGLAYLVMPDRAHAFDHGPLHPKSLFLFGVVVLPLFLGLMLGALSLRRLRPGLALTLGLPGLLLMAVGVTVLALAVLRAQHNTRGVVSVGAAYNPHLKWWLPVGLLALAAAFLILRRVWPRAVIVNLLSVLSLVGFMLVGLGFGLERLIAHTPYLVYVIGQPYYHPMIAPWVALIFAGATVLALAVALVGVKLRASATSPSFGAIPALLAVLLGAGCFAYVLWVPRDRMFARGVLCLDRDRGALRWQTLGLRAVRGIMHNDNSAATPTLVSDGERVYAYFGTAGIMATDRDGRLLWTYGQLPFISTEGVSSSPVVWEDKLIVLSESQAGQWLVALDGATGHLRWRTQRHQKMHLYAGNCRTPLIWPVRGRPTIIVWGLEDVSGYDPESGQELWTHNMGDFGSSTNPVACPVADGERLYLAGPTQTVALAPDKLGKPGSPILWTTPHMDGPQCATPVLGEGSPEPGGSPGRLQEKPPTNENRLLFMVSDTGTVYCLDARTGRSVWEQSFPQQHYASPFAVGDRVYFADTAGKTRIVACEPKYRLLATNDLKEPISASFAPVAGRLIVRTAKELWCLEQR